MCLLLALAPLLAYMPLLSHAPMEQSRTSAVQTVMLVPPVFASGGEYLSSEAFDAAVGSTDTIRHGVISVLFAIYMLFIVDSIWHDTMDSVNSASMDPASMDTDFGLWLQAALQEPLPTWEELQNGCHLLGDHRGTGMYLCAAAVDASCISHRISQPASGLYGKQVFVCRSTNAHA